MRLPGWIRRRPRLVIVFGAGLAAAALWIRCGPIAPDLLDDSRTTSTSVVDRHGVVLYESRSAAGTRTDRLDARHLPRTLVDATILIFCSTARSSCAIHPRRNPLAA